MTDRARVIIIRDGALALIERHRDGRPYYVFPGGGIEPGETPEAAAAREALEELGLVVTVGPCVAETIAAGDRQHFFLATPIGGSFGTGRGAEVTGRTPATRGTYRPVWFPLVEVGRVPILPPVVARFVAAVQRAGPIWPTGVAHLPEE